MNGVPVTGPLDVLPGRREGGANIIGMFHGGSEPLTLEEWLGVLNSRRVMIKEAKESVFQQQLGNVKSLGYGTLFSDKPEVAEGVLELRGIFFEEAVIHRDNPSRAYFVGVDSDGDWLLVKVRSKWIENARPQSRSIATSVTVRKCSTKAILRIGIDPLDLFRWMNNWVESLRDSRYRMLMRVIQLESLFAAQDLHVGSRMTFKEYCDYKLAEAPKA